MKTLIKIASLVLAMLVPATVIADTASDLRAIAVKEVAQPDVQKVLNDLATAVSGGTVDPSVLTAAKAKAAEIVAGLKAAAEKAPAADRVGFVRDATTITTALTQLGGGVASATAPTMVHKKSVETPTTGDNFRDGIARFLSKEKSPEWAGWVNKAVAYVDGGSLSDNDQIEVVDKLDTLAKGIRAAAASTQVRVDRLGLVRDATVLEELLAKVEAKATGAPTTLPAPVTTTPAPATATPPQPPVTGGSSSPGAGPGVSSPGLVVPTEKPATSAKKPLPPLPPPVRKQVVVPAGTK